LYLERAIPQAGKKIEWKRLFDTNDQYGKIENWPVADSYKPQYFEDGRINLKAFEEDQLIFLIAAIEEDKILFSK
jgi:hypothetical protein